MLEARIVTFDGGDGEMVTEAVCPAGCFCVGCGAAGTVISIDDEYLLCVGCRTVVPLKGKPYVAAHDSAFDPLLAAIAASVDAGSGSAAPVACPPLRLA